MDEKTIRIIPFTGEKETWCMWSGKFMEGSKIKGYHILITGAKTILDDDEDEIQEK